MRQTVSLADGLLLTGWQPCVSYGAAQVSKDVDFVLFAMPKVSPCARPHPNGASPPFLMAVNATLGDARLHNSRYRFGASALLNDLLRQIEKERTGAYQAPYVFSDATDAY